MDRSAGLREFVFGTQYYRPPTPTSTEWEDDLRAVHELGFSCVKIWMMWRWHERRRGAFAWDDTDRIFDLCEALGLKVNVNLQLDAAPDWLYRTHDCWRVTHTGQKVRPIALGAVYAGGVCPCFDDPRVREEAERFVAAAVARYRGRPGLLGWDVWNEPRYLTISRIGIPHSDDLECWCDASLVSYRDWLQERYGTVEGLNAATGKCWSEWDTVVPPTRYGDYTEMLLWRQWCMHSVTDQIRWIHDLVVREDPESPAFCHIGGCSVIQGPGLDPSDDERNSRAVDFYGTSLPCNDDPWTPAMICDWVRAVSPYYWVNEIYPSDPHWANRVTPELLRLRTWTPIAHGAKGILYWQYKTERLGDESAGYGLVGIDGSPTDRSEAVGAIAKAIAANPVLFRELELCPAEVGIVYDVPSDILSHIEKIAGTGAYEYKDAITGAYALFWLNNIAVDWLPSAVLEAEAREAGALERYKLVYLPAPMIVSSACAAALKRYVQGGGTLVAEASPGLRDANGWVSPKIPGPGLEELFGCRETSRVRDGGRHPLAFSTPAAVPVETDRVVARLAPAHGASTAAWGDGSCAAVTNSFGRGKATLVGTYLGGAYLSLRSEGMIRLQAQLAANAGVRPSVELESAPWLVSARACRWAGRSVIFLANHGRAAEHFTVRAAGRARWRKAVESPAIVDAQGDELGISLPAGEVLWLVQE